MKTRLSAEIFTICLRRAFRIAHGSSDTRQTVLARVEGAGLIGHGEGALPPYYPSTSADSLQWIAALPEPPAWPPDASLEEIVRWLPAAPRTAVAGRVAIEIALCDWWAQRRRQPLWQALGLKAAGLPICARTIPICSDAAELRGMLEEEPDAAFLKLKLGSGDVHWDEDCIRLTRACFPHVPLCVDVNEGWSPADAATLIERTQDCALAFVEQPVARAVEAWQEMKTRLGDASRVPLVADESLQSEADLRAFHGLADGVNIKLLKAGGLAAAFRWAQKARSMNFRLMIGVMVETGVGRTAAAQLAPLAEWLDIDPPADIPTAPLCGFRVAAGQLELSPEPGLGLRPVGALPS